MPSPGPSLVQPKGGTVEPRKVPWTRADARRRRRDDLVEFGGRALLHPRPRRGEEADTEVTVTLWEGTTDPEAACIQIAVEKETFVKLAKPLAGREVVDGAK